MKNPNDFLRPILGRVFSTKNIFTFSPNSDVFFFFVMKNTSKKILIFFKKKKKGLVR